MGAPRRRLLAARVSARGRCCWCATAASPLVRLRTNSFASAPCHAPWRQVRIARLLWLVARKEGAEALQRDLEAARSEVMGPFSGGRFEGGCV